MKTTHMICMSLACFIFFIVQTSCGASLNSVNIGISPYQGTEESKVVRRHVGQFILESPPNTSIIVYDAYALTEIARFQIPQLRFDSPEERARRLVEPFSKLAEWYKQRASKQVSPPLNGSGAMRIPEFLQLLSHQNYSEPYAVLMIGNPINLSVEEPSFSMIGNKVPSDGHIKAHITASIYGTAEKAGRLRGCVVHLCYLREDIWANQLVKESVQRFWGLFISQQNGKLVDFTADMDRTFATITQNDLAAVGNYQLNPTDSNLEMRVVHERSIPVKDANKVTIASAQVATNIPPIPVAPSGRMGIAAWWQADADVDLYVSVPGQRELYYGNLRNKYGEYYRDIRQANKQDTEQNWRTKWEYVELSERIPTAGLTCWLNLYKVNRGNTQPISGKVRVQYGDGHFVETPFRFNVTNGNGGADSGTRQSSPYWVAIDLRSATTHQ